jgi:DNA-binding transcriptional ArsR family regulator
MVPVFAALGDETRWSILVAILPVSRQAIAKHLAVLTQVGLVKPTKFGREVRYRVVGAHLSGIARWLETVGTAWDHRLAAVKMFAESP